MSQRKSSLRSSPFVVIPGGAGAERGTSRPPQGDGSAEAHLPPSPQGPAQALATLDAPVGHVSRRGAELTDEEIADAVREGNTEIANELYHRLVDAVDITLYRIFGRRESEHEDLIQRSFEQIVLTLSKRSYAGACSLRTWSSAITARVAFNVLRSKKRERTLLVFSPDEPEASSRGYVDAEKQNLARAELEALRHHLTKMKPERAQAVFLHDVLGHELAEIAVMENVTVAAAQSRLVRGRKELHRKLGLPSPSTFGPRLRPDSPGSANSPESARVPRTPSDMEGGRS